MRLPLVLVLLYIKSAFCDEDDTLFMNWVKQQLDVSGPDVKKSQPSAGSTHCLTTDSKEGRCVIRPLCNEKMATARGDDTRYNKKRCSTSALICCQLTYIQDSISDSPKMPRGCGWRNPNGVDSKLRRPIAGEANFGEFPWIIAIFRVYSQHQTQYVGVGSLIHPSAVLTAAFNVMGGEKFKARAGEWDSLTETEIYKHREQDVDKIVSHENFNPANLFNNIAILFLRGPMEMAPNVGLACLPSSHQLAENTRCYASGWGKTDFAKKDRLKVKMEKAEISLVDRQQCVSSLRYTRLGRFFELHTSFMCADNQLGSGDCKGRSGSPLMCPIELGTERYFQYGMVAWGVGCHEPGVPGVFVDVSHFRNWIDDKMAGHGYDSTTYTPD